MSGAQVGTHTGRLFDRDDEQVGEVMPCGQELVEARSIAEEHQFSILRCTHKSTSW